MKRINLRVVSGPHHPSQQAGRQVIASRLVVRVSFARPDRWSDFDVAIVDTGAPLSLLPERMWRDIDRQVLGDVVIGGVAEKPECRFLAHLALVQCIISDGTVNSGPVQMHALLAHNNKVPALLGLSGILEQADLFVSLRSQTAYLETAF